MKKIPSNKTFAVLGLVAACATVLMWSRQDAQQQSLGAPGDAFAASSRASGSFGGASLRSVAHAAPTPRNDAQAKLGGGQLLEAVQWLAQTQAANASSSTAATTGAAASGSSGSAQGAAKQAISAAAQIAALDRAGIPRRFREGEKVKVNLDLALSFEDVQNPSLLDRATSTLRETLLAAGMQATQVNGSPVLEALVPLAKLEWVAGLQSVAQVSLMKMSQTAVFSDGATASNIDHLRTLGNYDQLAENLRRDLRGESLNIAIIDHFGNLNGEVAALQAAGEWPRNTAAEPNKITMRALQGQAFGHRGAAHGNAVTEIVYDIAPAASFRVYDSSGAADWVSAVQDAANLDAQNVSQGEPRSQVITASLGFDLYGPGDGTGTGSGLKGLYDAIEAATRNGVLVLNAAGNEAQKHWDGNSTAGAVANVRQDFDLSAAGVDTVNRLNLGADFGGCIPVGAFSAEDQDDFEVSATLGWNDWTNANNLTDADYRLELVRWADAVRRNGRVITPAGWVVATQSDELQNGGAGQTPLEGVSFIPSAATRTAECNGVFNANRFAGGGKFGLRVVRKTAGANNFLRLMIGGYYTPQYAQAERSLVHPADSASVITVAALDAATSNLEAYSSRGPVLAAGGARPNGQAVGNAKPDMANFANVDTVSYGDNEFNGTSSATPHVAALALLGLQHQRQLTNATVPVLPANPTEQQRAAHALALRQRNVSLAGSVQDSLTYVAGTGGNDLGVAGFDSSYGTGRLKFHAQSQACFLSALYDPAYRGLLPAQANPLPAGQKSYDVLHGENDTACSDAVAQ
ncbi:S8 family serine peptidase [Lysobacter antibioticus]|uniref:Subtilase family protein n=1 Tax=Lysobacter antibioticus TaxID=84531 RepID=A0A0S2F5N7_LYSAN|nr:S8 family serine peptidase [Lysobacter antibioticus]ALN78873.1 subtilase family protein [Lysobacter antibioticus]